MTSLTDRPITFHQPYTVLSGSGALPDYLGLVKNTSVAPATWTLPHFNTPVTNVVEGAELKISNTTPFAITVETQGSDTIDGLSSVLVFAFTTAVIRTSGVEYQLWCAMGDA